MTTEMNFAVHIPASDTWRINKEFPSRKGIQRIWKSNKISGPSANKFQIKLFNSVFTFSHSRTTEISHLVIRNCKLRKVIVERIDLSISNEGIEKIITTDLQRATLNRSGAKDCGCGITFDKNLFVVAGKIGVKIKISNGPQIKLKDDLHRLLMDELSSPFFADTTLEVGENDELKCHGFMLAARSKVLKACLKQDGFSESKSKRIKVDDMSLNSVKELLKFIYTDSFDADEDNIYELFLAAEKYDIPNLKTECEAILLDDLDVDSAAECFQLAFLCRSGRLLEKSAQIIAENLDEVKETEGWKALDVKSSNQVLQEGGKCLVNESLAKLMERIGISAD